MKSRTVLALVALSLLRGTAWPSVLTVDPASGPYATIAEAAADALPGDEIQVYPGVYAEDVELPAGVMLIALEGPLETIIDGEGTREEVVVLGSNQVIDGFAIRGSADGGFAIGSHEPAVGSLVVNCDISDSETGIRLAAGSSDIVLMDDLIYDNRGPGIAMEGASPVELLGVTIAGCASGIDVDGETEVFIRNAIVAFNGGPGIRDARETIQKIEVHYSDVHGNDPDWSGLDARIAWDRGEGIISADPLFVDPETADYRPGACSPVVDAGDPDPFFEDCGGTRAEMGAFCGEAGGAPRDLACTAGPAGIELAWQNAGAYDAVRVVRDGATIATLPGSADRYTDADAPIAAIYRVEGVAGEGACASVPCGATSYRLRSSDDDPEVAYAWLDIGAAPELPPGDDLVWPTPIGFSFPFFGLSYDMVRIAVDGYLLFSSDPPGEPAPIPSPEPPNLLVAGYGSDLSTDLATGQGRVRVAVLGAAGDRVFVAEWENVSHPIAPGGEETPERFQIRLREATGRIEVAYRTTSTRGGRSPERPWEGVTVGIEDATGLAGVALGFTREGMVHDGLQIVFDPAPPAPAVFLRGDVDGDGGMLLNDPILLLGFLFAGGAPPACPDAGDMDDSGDFTIGDAIWALNYLFGGGAPPADPGPRICGPDPTADDLDPCAYPTSRCP